MVIVKNLSRCAFLFVGFLYLALFPINSSASTIDFNSLGNSGVPYLGHIEDGFSIAPSGSWTQLIGVDTFIQTSDTPGLLVITGTSLFTLESIDFGVRNFGTSANYFMDGFRDGSQVFNHPATLGCSLFGGCGFTTINNPSSGVLLDQLIVGFSLGDSNAMMLDNIVLSTVPIPSAIWLFGTTFFYLLGVAKKNK